jgi:hypothetical protein
MEKVYDLYEKCSDWLNGDDTHTPKEIIESAIDILADINNKELSSLWQKCVVHINNWEEFSLDEQICRAEMIMEELCGYLGEYLES